MIKIITTGGTIEGLDYSEEDTVAKRKKVFIEDFFKEANVSFSYSLEKATEKDSRQITDTDRDILVDRISNSKEEKIIITHGTITMIETAKYIGKFDLNKTIVLVGSFVLGSSEHTDAPFNMGFAICALQFLKPGVYIAMNGQIFHWKNVTKNTINNQFERRDG